MLLWNVHMKDEAAREKFRSDFRKAWGAPSMFSEECQVAWNVYFAGGAFFPVCRLTLIEMSSGDAQIRWRESVEILRRPSDALWMTESYSWAAPVESADRRKGATPVAPWRSSTSLLRLSEPADTRLDQSSLAG
jgi:hypothetical protein